MLEIVAFVLKIAFSVEDPIHYPITMDSFQMSGPHNTAQQLAEL